MITLERDEWHAISRRIWEEYPPSWSLIRDVMRRELGFTVRTGTRNMYLDDIPIYLDFFDEQKEVWFRLKYL